MAVSTGPQPLPEPPGTRALLDSARHGAGAVALALDGQAGKTLPLDGDQAVQAANFLAYTMYTVQIANGLHPKSSVDFLQDGDRGSELARGFLAAGTVEVCCDYCGQLMAAALSGAAAAQMTAIHGDQAAGQWQNLTYALAGPPF